MPFFSSKIQPLSKLLQKLLYFVCIMFLKILILFVLFDKCFPRIVLTGTNRGRKMGRRNMVLNMRPILEDNEPIFGRVDVTKDMTMKSGDNAENPFALEELAHKIGEYLCDKDKNPGSVATRRIHKKHRKARSNNQDETPQTKSISNTRKDTLIDLENRIINPIYTAEEAWERHRRIKRKP